MKRFEALDGLRGICALGVVIFHWDTVLHTGRLLNHAYLAVDVFFVLSGFVIAHTYEARLAGGMSAGQFLKARGRRLLPVHFVGTAIASLAAITFWSMGSLALPGATAITVAAAFVSGMLIIPQYFIAGSSFPLNPVLWSLWGEWVANIVYSLGLHTMRTRLLLAIAAAFWGIETWHAFHNPLGWLDSMPQDNFVGVVARAVGGFFAGVCLLRAYRRGLLDKLPSLSPHLIFALWLALFAVPTPSATPEFDMVAAALIAPLSVALLVRNERPMAKSLAWLGAISYPLYASHAALLAVAAACIGEVHSLRGSVYAIALTFASLLLAVIVKRIADALPVGKKEAASVRAPLPVHP